MTPMTNIQANSDSPRLFQSAFDRSAADRAALDPSKLAVINLDMPSAVTTVLGAAPRAMTFRDAAAALPAFDIQVFDKLETYAGALSYANTAYRASSEPPAALPPLLEHATKLRETLLLDASALAHRGLLDPKPLGELKAAVGYLNVASDLGILVRMLRTRSADIANKSAITTEELDDAEHVSEQITIAYAARARQSATSTAASDDRQRAYTLLVEAYDNVRRAITFLRWHEGDIDKIVPSLYAGRGPRGSSSADADPDDDTIVAPPALPPGATGAQERPGTTNTPAPPHAAPIASGLPGGSPFTDA